MMKIWVFLDVTLCRLYVVPVSIFTIHVVLEARTICERNMDSAVSFEMSVIIYQLTWTYIQKCIKFKKYIKLSVLMLLLYTVEALLHFTRVCFTTYGRCITRHTCVLKCVTLTTITTFFINKLQCKQMWDQLDATISDFIVNQLFLKVFRASLCPALCGVGCLTEVKQPTPHSAHSLPAVSPTSQQSQQDR